MLLCTRFIEQPRKRHYQSALNTSPFPLIEYLDNLLIDFNVVRRIWHHPYFDLCMTQNLNHIWSDECFSFIRDAFTLNGKSLNR